MAAPAGVHSTLYAVGEQLRTVVQESSESWTAASWVYLDNLFTALTWRQSNSATSTTTLMTLFRGTMRSPLGVAAQNTAALAAYDTMRAAAVAAAGVPEQAAVGAAIDTGKTDVTTQLNG